MAMIDRFSALPAAALLAALVWAGPAGFAAPSALAQDAPAEPGTEPPAEPEPFEIWRDTACPFTAAFPQVPETQSAGTLPVRAIFEGEGYTIVLECTKTGLEPGRPSLRAAADAEQSDAERDGSLVDSFIYSSVGGEVRLSAVRSAAPSEEEGAAIAFYSEAVHADGHAIVLTASDFGTDDAGYETMLAILNSPQSILDDAEE